MAFQWQRAACLAGQAPKQREHDMLFTNRRIATAGLVIIGGLSLSACATEDYVNKHIAVVNDRIGALETRVNTVDQTAQQANATAQSAAGAAQQANSGSTNSRLGWTA